MFTTDYSRTRAIPVATRPCQQNLLIELFLVCMRLPLESSYLHTTTSTPLKHFLDVDVEKKAKCMSPPPSLGLIPDLHDSIQLPFRISILCMPPTGPFRASLHLRVPCLSNILIARRLFKTVHDNRKSSLKNQHLLCFSLTPSWLQSHTVGWGWGEIGRS